jgi:hypothetical protein
MDETTNILVKVIDVEFFWGVGVAALHLVSIVVATRRVFWC